ncbi:hypothetical protein QR680_015014 [Steinernema hermaphroditum]|uniref:Uncharacterized protein n=1 Tax=Steinernema hermaphroditum TaxID=289476 RepID=A0AA39IAT1_9BILA|nr:hypothetical protein QR680_015014 [Steinernema hermaphroditum]
MKFVILILTLCLCHSVTPISSSVQSTAVRGKLICDSAPAANIKVSLYNENVIEDTLMATMTTDSNGEFELKGNDSEVTSIDPRLYVYHKCRKDTIQQPLLLVGFDECSRKAIMVFEKCEHQLKIQIPDDYITQGEVPEKVLDMGVLQLAVRYNFYQSPNDQHYFHCTF